MTFSLSLLSPSFSLFLIHSLSPGLAFIVTDSMFVSIPVTTFVVSAIVSHQHKLDMVHIQNSTLAGGVAVGSVCNLLISPHGALLIGTISAIISVFGYRYLTVGYNTISIYVFISNQFSLCRRVCVCGASCTFDSANSFTLSVRLCVQQKLAMLLLLWRLFSLPLSLLFFFSSKTI